MLMLDIINFCNDIYTNSDTEHMCDKCKNNCLGSCDKCLDSIHFNKVDRTYNCKNIVNYYVCKYSYKYSSEIEAIFKNIEEIQEIKRYNIMSIGCGPCTDLFGIMNNIETNKLNKEVQYLGVDLNEIWKPVHNRIKELEAGKTLKTRFVYSDVFNVISKLKINEDTWKPNILIFQYVISDMVKYNTKQEILQFIDRIIDYIIDYMPKNSFIILNDINHNTQARNYYEYMYDCVYKRYKNTTCWKYHFNNDNRHYYRYGERYNYNETSINIPTHINETYNPWRFCSSAQMIIQKNE